MQLLSKIPSDPTVGFLRAKKESGSTHRGQRVGTSFLEFRQNLKGRGFTLLELHFCKCFVDDSVGLRP